MRAPGVHAWINRCVNFLSCLRVSINLGWMPRAGVTRVQGAVKNCVRHWIVADRMQLQDAAHACSTLTRCLRLVLHHVCCM